jgi:hypothetical protein
MRCGGKAGKTKKNTKSQTPSTKEAPNFKNQRPKTAKPQLLLAARGWVPKTSLGLGASLFSNGHSRDRRCAAKPLN